MGKKKGDRGRDVYPEASADNGYVTVKCAANAQEGVGGRTNARAPCGLSG